MSATGPALTAATIAAEHVPGFGTDVPGLPADVRARPFDPAGDYPAASASSATSTPVDRFDQFPIAEMLAHLARGRAAASTPRRDAVVARGRRRMVAHRDRRATGPRRQGHPLHRGLGPPRSAPRGHRARAPEASGATFCRPPSPGRRRERGFPAVPGPRCPPVEPRRGGLRGGVRLRGGYATASRCGATSASPSPTSRCRRASSCGRSVPRTTADLGLPTSRPSGTTGRPRERDESDFEATFHGPHIETPCGGSPGMATRSSAAVMNRSTARRTRGSASTSAGSSTSPRAGPWRGRGDRQRAHRRLAARAPGAWNGGRGARRRCGEPDRRARACTSELGFRPRETWSHSTARPSER